MVGGKGAFRRAEIAALAKIVVWASPNGFYHIKREEEGCQRIYRGSGRLSGY